MPNQTLIVILRLLHIMGGFFWAGSTLMLARFIFPAVRATGPAGAAITRQLVEKQKLPIAMNVAALITILAGLGLMWEMQSLSNGTWIHSATGMTFTLGGLLGITSAVVGSTVARPTAQKLGQIGALVAASQQPPTAEQSAQMQALQMKLAKTTGILSVVLSLAVALMAIARYV